MVQQLPEVGHRAVPGGIANPVNTQVTVDCTNPHAQAEFWAAALGYVLEDPHDFIEALIAAGHADRERDTITFHGKLAWKPGIGILHPDDIDLPRGTGRRILFMAVPDRSSAKNAWHLDLNVGRDNIDAEVARLVALGAVEKYTVDEPGGFHTTLADPEGNLFCVG